LALLEAGVGALAVYDVDRVRSEALVSRLKGKFGDKARFGSADPRGYTIVINASPTGMGSDDPYPIDVNFLDKTMLVGDVITAPVETPLLLAARERGCTTISGVDMFTAVATRMVQFLNPNTDVDST
jgi:shikimate dehydrogenase